MIEKKKKKMEKRVREVFGCEETKNKKRSFHSFTGNRSREGEKGCIVLGVFSVFCFCC